MTESNKIPKHWQVKKLSDIGEIVSGGTPSTKVSDYWDGNISWISPADLSGYSNTTITKGRKSITKEGLKNSSARLIPKGSVLFSSRAPIGYVVIAGNEVCTNQGFKSIVPNKLITTDYLFFYLKASKQKAEKVASGTTFKEISLKAFSILEIPLPPLPEQQAIVSKIEELFSELDNGIAQLKTAKQQLKVYRQSLLNTIVSRKNCKTIQEVIEKLDQGWSPKCFNENSKDEKEWAVIKTSAVQHGHFIEIENKILPPDLKPRIQHELEVGDILITRAGPRVRVGVCCMIRKTRQRLINCDKVYRIKVNTKIISSEYFELLLNTPHYQREIEKMKSGISDSGLNLTQAKFLKIEIPIPTLKQQQLIVSELESKLTVCDKIEETISQSLQQAETLRQSILKKAFSGELLKNHGNPKIK